MKEMVAGLKAICGTLEVFCRNARTQTVTNLKKSSSRLHTAREPKSNRANCNLLMALTAVIVRKTFLLGENHHCKNPARFLLTDDHNDDQPSYIPGAGWNFEPP
jgi:hypothetical protein